MTNSVLAWLGAAVLAVALNAWGGGPLVKRTLQACIIYLLLVNADRIQQPLNKWINGLSLRGGFAGGRGATGTF